MKFPVSKAKTAYGVLSEIAALALEEPKRMRMGIYIDRQKKETDQPAIGVAEWPACGTVGCIAGWVYALHKNPNFGGYGVQPSAQSTLGLTDEQTITLFHPDNLCCDLDQGTKAHARRVVAHIRKFQKAFKTQLLAKRVY